MSTRKPTKLRGPSRPVDPRYAPGRPSRSGPDRFGVALIGVSTAVVLLILLFLSIRQPSTATTPAVPAVSGTTSQPTAAGDPTQQAIALATQQEIAFATETTSLPRVSPADAKALYDAQNVKMIDVRLAQYYKEQHIKGATNIPNDQIKTRLAEFPHTGNVVVYCQ